MGIIDWVRLVCFLHFLGSTVNCIFRRKVFPLFGFVSGFVSIYPYISSTFWLIPHTAIYEFVYPVYDYTFSWQGFFVIGFSWGFFAYVAKKVPRMRIMYRRCQGTLKKLGILAFFMMFYVKFIDYNTVTYGICEVPDPAEYLKNVETVPVASRFWSICCSFLILIFIFVCSCMYCLAFYIPISIA